jgi:hypothetical protein
MPSRRRRKRYRRLAAKAGLRGDRQRPPTDDLGSLAEGGWGTLCGDWESASLSDLRLLRQAINENWPVPPDRRGPLMAAVLSQLHREDRSDRLTLAVCQVAVAAVRHNLNQEAAERRAAKRQDAENGK